jgi:hypothetical protein
MGFFESFLQLYKDLNPDLFIKEFQDPAFRNIYLEENGYTLDSIKAMAPSLLKGMLKPQRPIDDFDQFYIGQDLYTNTFYICYSNLLMVDIDFYKNGETKTLEAIKAIFESYTESRPDLRFRLYRSRNGVHAFLISEAADYKKDFYLQMMLDLDCDFYYAIYAFLRGWSVRINRKKTDQDPLYELIGDIGSGNINSDQVKMVDLHLRLCDVFKNTGSNLMYDG